MGLLGPWLVDWGGQPVVMHLVMLPPFILRVYSYLGFTIGSTQMLQENILADAIFAQVLLWTCCSDASES